MSDPCPKPPAPAPAPSGHAARNGTSSSGEARRAQLAQHQCEQRHINDLPKETLARILHLTLDAAPNTGSICCASYRRLATAHLTTPEFFADDPVNLSELRHPWLSYFSKSTLVPARRRFSTDLFARLSMRAATPPVRPVNARASTDPGAAAEDSPGLPAIAVCKLWREVVMTEHVVTAIAAVAPSRIPRSVRALFLRLELVGAAAMATCARRAAECAPNLEVLVCCGGPELDWTYAAALAPHLPSMTNIQTFDISLASPSPAAARALVQAITLMPRLHSLRLSAEFICRCSANSSRASAASNALKDGSSEASRSSNGSNAALTPPDVASMPVLATLSRLTSLRSLLISHVTTSQRVPVPHPLCGLTQLSALTQLEVLDLSNAELDESSALRAINAVPALTGLRALSLRRLYRDRAASVRGVVTLASRLSALTALDTLRLDDIIVGNAGLRALGATLTSLQCLATLGLCVSCVDIATFRDFMRHLPDLRGLRDLTLRGKPIRVEILVELAAHVTLMDSVEVLRLSDTSEQGHLHTFHGVFTSESDRRAAMLNLACKRGPVEVLWECIHGPDDGEESSGDEYLDAVYA